MGIWISNFSTTEAYEAAESSLATPHVSLTQDNMQVHYIPYVPQETRVVAKYNVTSTSSPTALRTSYESNVFKSMEIDGVMLDELVTAYTFDTVGIHTVKYELYDDTKLGNNAPVFNGSNLVECIIPNSVTNIGDNAFARCTMLTSVTIGNGVTSIGEGAFSECTSLTSIDIPNSVTSIVSYAFAYCSSLSSVTIGNSVTSISNSAFYFCDRLTSIVIHDSVTSIGYNAFANCTSLTSCTIGSGVTTIGLEAFYNCRSLTSVTVNATTPPTLDEDAFKSNASGRKIYVPSASVETYKSATNWSTYASDIEPIS